MAEQPASLTIRIPLIVWANDRLEFVYEHLVLYAYHSHMFARIACIVHDAGSDGNARYLYNCIIYFLFYLKYQNWMLDDLLFIRNNLNNTKKV